MLKKRLTSLEFIQADPTDEWWEGQSNPLILDTVVGLQSVSVFTSLNSFENPKFRITPHDYDLFMDLAFLLKLKKIHSFTLIGVPQQGNQNELVEKIVSEIETISARSSV